MAGRSSMVRGRGLEPPWYSPHAPQTCASAGSATLACVVGLSTRFIISSHFLSVNIFFKVIFSFIYLIRLQNVYCNLPGCAVKLLSIYLYQRSFCVFGYILPYRPELTEKDLEKYRAYYCGLCHAMGKSFGLVSRLTLSYDFSFLSLVYSSLDYSDVSISQSRCLFNPMRKHPKAETTFYTEFCAATAISMAYYKCKDNIDDSSFLKSLPYRFYKLLLTRPARKVKKQYPGIWNSVSSMYKEQIISESDPNASLDRVADPTASMLSKLASYFSKNQEQIPHLQRFGYMLGRYIYLCDAIDDLPQDKANGSFNPLLCPPYSNLSENDLWDRIQEIMNLTMTEVVASFQKIKIIQNQSILENFIYFGLNNTFNAILKKRKVNNHDGSLQSSEH